MILALCAIEINAQSICTSDEPLTPAGQFFCGVAENSEE